MLVFPGPIFTPPAAGGASSFAWDPAAKGANLTLSTTNFSNDTASYGSGNAVVLGTIGKSSGKWYFELAAGAGAVANGNVGIAKAGTSGEAYLGSSTSSMSNGANGGGWYVNNVGNGSSPSYTSSDIIGLAVDLDNLKIAVNKNNGTWHGQFSGADPAAGTAMATIPSSGTWYPGCTCYSSGNAFRILQTLTYSPPSGFSQWA